ncbi:MAG: DNA polymerase III subunit alpha, partial [Pseudomonadota bacterium]
MIDGLLRVPELMQCAAAGDMPAVSLTDAGNLFAMVKFYRRAVSAGLKPVVGVELAVFEATPQESRDTLIVLCQDATGYRNLTQLITRAYLEGQHHGRPAVARAWLTPASTAGLIALSGGFNGDLARLSLNGIDATVRQRAADWLTCFEDRYYLQVSRTERPGERRWIHNAVLLSNELGIPVVATNDVRFLTREDFDAHEARVCIYQGRTLADNSRPRPYSEHQYLKSAAEMRELFSDLPAACDNTLAIAARCSLDLELGKSVLPEFPVPEGFTTEAWLAQESRDGLAARPRAVEADTSGETYEVRLERELETICSMGFAGYFLIVADFIRWARDNAVPVGPGRGSGAGSLVAYALGITDIDPMEHDLLFERFLNPERVSMPDFDVDFCMEGRDSVIAYVAERYGRQRVSQIITYGTMAAKAVVRDA